MRVWVFFVNMQFVPYQEGGP